MLRGSPASVEGLIVLESAWPVRTFSFISLSASKSLKLFLALSRASKQDWIVEFIPHTLNEEETTLQSHGDMWSGQRALVGKRGQEERGKKKTGGRVGEKREDQRRDSWRQGERLCGWSWKGNKGLPRIFIWKVEREKIQKRLSRTLEATWAGKTPYSPHCYRFCVYKWSCDSKISPPPGKGLYWVTLLIWKRYTGGKRSGNKISPGLLSNHHTG